MEKSVLILMVLAMFQGCATPGVDRADEQIIIQQFYASVEAVEAIKLSSNIGNGALVGAGVGIIEEADGNSEDMIAGGIAGALVGVLFTAVQEGSDQAYQYTLHNQEKGRFHLIQKEELMQSVRCVRVQVARKAKLFAAPDSACIH